MADLTHADLVARAARWLRNSRKLSVVLVECGAWSISEHPDAIGWNWMGESTLVECKRTRADFHADKRKTTWMPRGMGHRRFYMTPPGLLSIDDLPGGYGLAEVHGRRVRVIKEAQPLDTRERRTEDPCLMEVRLLVAEMRRQFVEREHPVGPSRRNGLVDVATAAEGAR